MTDNPENKTPRPLQETHPHLKDFIPWLELLNKESDRGKVLVSSGFMEQQLKDILKAFLIPNSGADTLFDGANAPLGSFSSRIAACFALGLISDEEHHDLSLIRKIRNDFAHNVHTSFATPSVANRCSELYARAKDYPGVTVGAQGEFTTAAASIILHLVNRAHYVSKKRCVEGGWPY